MERAEAERKKEAASLKNRLVRMHESLYTTKI